MSRLQPLRNWPAMDRTSDGFSARSKACGTGAAAFMMFITVWWRASTVMIEAAADSNAGSEMEDAAPRYALTPTFSINWAKVIIVFTSVKAEEKSNLQPVIGWPPRALTAA